MTTLPLMGLEREEAALTLEDVRNRRAIRLWLHVVALMIFAIVLVGGGTRIMEAGLSITEWKPIHGIVPPLSAQEWQEEFDLYRQIPQYQLVNRGMSLDEFKVIFWWEWAHRFLARAVGFAFAIPLAFFWLTGRVESRLKPRLLALLALGGLQGAVGWWMVASGLVERTDVSQYRLAVHLTLACIIFTAVLWVAEGLAADRRAERQGRFPLAAAVLGLSLLQIYLGGLVAGLNAGLTFNTWPLMDGQWVPGNLLRMEPLWRNFFENVMTVQFTHRVGAYVLFGVVLAYALLARTRETRWLLALVTIQAGIGIATLLLAVPMDLALLHQGGAIVVLAAAVVHARRLKGPYPAPVAA
ncbi:COX15/CtaA family protein [Aureimonas populi]|uniref:Heme A synthase n=1 Tax=Aureimonas populi TaxID=1701758 RepID=A0ABW5CHA9_9HYPH|nr:COX15/CtaA family protein [Aureimonas populi]